MRYTIPFLLILTGFILSSSTIKKGCGGVYYIIGKAYKLDKAITSQELTVQLGEKKWQVSTNSEGSFDIEIPWMSACPSGLSPGEREKENERLNPSPIVITYKNSKLTLRNEWKKYGKCISESKEQITWEKDLVFK